METMPRIDRSSFSSAPVCVTCGTQYPETERMTGVSRLRRRAAIRRLAGPVLDDDDGDRRQPSDPLRGCRRGDEPVAGAIVRHWPAGFPDPAGGRPCDVGMPSHRHRGGAGADRRYGPGSGDRHFPPALSQRHARVRARRWAACRSTCTRRTRTGCRSTAPSCAFGGGDRFALTGAVDLVHLPGHFAGSTGLLWKNGPRPGGSLFPGDALQVAMDRRFVSFMRSYPQHAPAGAQGARPAWKSMWSRWRSPISTARSRGGRSSAMPRERGGGVVCPLSGGAGGVGRKAGAMEIKRGCPTRAPRGRAFRGFLLPAGTPPCVFLQENARFR